MSAPLSWALGAVACALLFTLSVHLGHLLGLGHPHPRRHLLRRLHLHVSVALVVGLVTFFVAGALGAGVAYVVLRGPHGVVQPPAVAQQPHGAPSTAKRGLGFVAGRGRRAAPHTFGALSVPAAVDLSQNAPAVGNQGAVQSCGAWAVGYYLRGWYAARDGHMPAGGLAPMYVYAQAAGGANVGTSFGANYAVVAQQGIDSAADYYQGFYNYWDQPTPAERQNALQWRSLGMQPLFLGRGQGAYAQQAIAAALAGGDPVTLGVPVYDNFWRANAGSYYIAGVAGSYYGDHAVTAFKYDQNGVWVENQWGTGWGLNGWAELSWDFIASYAIEADMMLMPHRTVVPVPPAATATARPRLPAHHRLHPRPHARPTARPRARPRPAARWLLVRDQRARRYAQSWPSQRRLLRRGLVLHCPVHHGAWRRCFTPYGGLSWVWGKNLRRLR